MKDNKYITVMFPYPSGSGLHIGHFYNYAIMDSYCRYWKYRGKEVFQPFGYDSFGLPAENYAKQVGRDPKDVTYENIRKFRIQMDRMNTNYQELLITSDPSYQKWTQWLFTKLKEHGFVRYVQLKEWTNPFKEDKKTFAEWLKCYGKKEMSNIVDKNGRKFWYSPKHVVSL